MHGDDQYLSFLEVIFSMSTKVPLEFGRHWAEMEDTKLSDYVSRNGTGNWNAVAANVGTGRTANSCRQRWFEFHCHGVTTGEFTPEEKLTTLLLHSKWEGNRWSKIAKRLPGRTSNQVKNYYNKIIKKKASDFPKAIIKTLVETVEAQGKDIQSCLHPSAYKEFVRVYAEPPPAAQQNDNGIPNFAGPPQIPHAPPQQNEYWLATEAGATIAPSSTGIADYGDLMLPETGDILFSGIPDFAGPPEIPHAPPQQNEGLAGEGFDLMWPETGDILFSGIPNFDGPPEIPHGPPQQNEFDDGPEFNLDRLDLTVEFGDQKIEFLSWAFP